MTTSISAHSFEPHSLCDQLPPPQCADSKLWSKNREVLYIEGSVALSIDCYRRVGCPAAPGRLLPLALLQTSHSDERSLWRSARGACRPEAAPHNRPLAGISMRLDCPCAAHRGEIKQPSIVSAAKACGAICWNYFNNRSDSIGGSAERFDCKRNTSTDIGLLIPSFSGVPDPLECPSPSTRIPLRQRSPRV
jgi:hypothetical protein